MSAHSTLEASTHDRKARLAQLRSLKRKQQSSPPPPSTFSSEDTTSESATLPSRKRKSPSPSPPSTQTYLSGRNYDPSTRGPRLGFDTAPSTNLSTLESRAAILSADAKAIDAADAEEADRPLDLFKLAPKRANWDLRRDLERKLEGLNVRTDNAIARLVRERIKGKEDGEGDGELVGRVREMEREFEGRELEGGI